MSMCSKSHRLKAWKPNVWMIQAIFLLSFIAFTAGTTKKVTPERTDRKINDELDDILLNSLIPEGSVKCKRQFNKYTSQIKQSFTMRYDIATDFSSPNASSSWSPNASRYESDLFLAEMSHLDPQNSNQTWTMRIGQGGNVYSFHGPYGEAMPPQFQERAEFVDEVMQSVSVNLDKNRNSDHKYIIHEAGVYRSDESFIKDDPFFSPNIAKYCKRGSCSFGSWGQQAHLATPHQSDLLYFNSYRDCGGGVIEMTSVIHNAAEDLDHGVELTYMNIPWGGVRHSNLRDVFLSKPNGIIELDFPPKSFFGDGIVELRDTGGYTTFAEQVIVPEDVYSEHVYHLPQNIQLIINGNPSSQYTKYHSEKQDAYCLRSEIQPVTAVESGCTDCNLWFHNERTGDKILVHIVLHWAWEGNKLFFCPDGIDQKEFNKKFIKGDTITVSYANIGKPMEDNLALTFVHGLETNLDQRWASSRMRYGNTWNVKRDYTVYTMNTRVNINPGDTYIAQQYIVTGSLSDAETVAKTWVDQVYEDIYPIGELTIGMDIHLMSIPTVQKTFGAVVADSDLRCFDGRVVCSGKSAPQYGLKPLFAIECGNNRYVGSDKYYFSPPQTKIRNAPIRSYVCMGESPHTRPRWKLLGFFEEGSCDALKHHSYNEDLCRVYNPYKGRHPRSEIEYHQWELERASRSENKT